MCSRRVNRCVVIDIATGVVERREAHGYSGQWALCEGEDPPPADKPAQQPLPGTVLSDADKRVSALEAENARLKTESEKRDRDLKSRKAEKDGKLKEELDRTNADLLKARQDHEALNKSIRARVDRTIAKLPKDVQEEISLIKDDLPLSKLEALVERKSEVVTTTTTDDNKTTDTADTTTPKPNPPPTPGVKATTTAPYTGHQIHAETASVMRSVYADETVYDISKGIGVDSVGKFGWGRTDEEEESTGNFMHLLRRIAAVPEGGLPDSVLVSRVTEKK